MTIAPQRPAAMQPRTGSAGRDSGIDLIRAICVIAVVTLHALMVGVTVTADGPVFANAADGTWWLTPLSWVFQVMPLFFVVGGFAGWNALHRSRARGGTDASFVSARLGRLLIPASVAIAAAGLALAVLGATGAAPDLVQIAGYRYAQPLWFLGVFVLCQALLPALARAHRLAPGVSIGSLVAAAAAVDALRLVSGIEVLGFLNLALVWLALQQLGFFLADGRIDALSRRTRFAIAVGAALALAADMMLGIHSPDLIANLNPPTTALLLVGLVHTMLLSLCRARLMRVADRPGITALHTFVNRRAMTVYLWHMPVLLTLAGSLALVFAGAPGFLAEPSSTAWWLTRPLWLAAALTGTALIALLVAPLEALRPSGRQPSAARLVIATAAGISAVALLLVVGTTPLTALVAVVLIVIALRSANGPAPLRRGAHTSKYT